MALKSKKPPATNPGGNAKSRREDISEQAKMEDRNRRAEPKGKLTKGSRRRAG